MLGSYAEITESMDFNALVVREGDRATATGRLVHNDTGDWFEPPLPVALPGGMPRGVGAVWRGAIRVVGANFDQLSDRYERDGAVDGFATLIGIWSASQLRVERQTLPDRLHTKPPRWVTPPCPAPEGGWPHVMWGHGDQNLDYDLGDLQDTGAAVAVTTFRPSEDQAVLVVAAADPAAVEAQLRPQLGQLLCVVPSKWSRAELDVVRAHLHAHHEEWDLYQWGAESSTEDGQARITASLTRMLAEIAAWGATLPPGILALEAWLTRVPD
jgi:hypothetical protein